MSKRRKKFLVRVCEPQFVHYQATNKETGKVEDTTIMKGKYAIPWHSLTDIPITERALKKIEKLKKSFPDVSIEFNFNKANPAFILGVSGKTIRHEGDEPDQILGNKVARARAMARACVVGRHIALVAKESLEEELNRSIDTFQARFKREKRIIKGV